MEKLIDTGDGTTLHHTGDAQGTFGALGHGSEENCEAPVLVKQLWAVGIVMVGRAGRMGK